VSNPFQSADPWEVSLDQLLPAGNHVVVIEEAEMGTSSGKHPQIEIKLRNSYGAIRDWMVITEASVGKVVALAQAVEVDLPTDNDIEQGLALKQVYVDRFVGKKVGIVVRDEPDYKDPTKTRPRVQGYVEAKRIKASDIPPNGESDFRHAPQNPSADIPF
jgi:hypothetical protein